MTTPKKSIKSSPKPKTTSAKTKAVSPKPKTATSKPKKAAATKKAALKPEAIAVESAEEILEVVPETVAAVEELIAHEPAEETEAEIEVEAEDDSEPEEDSDSEDDFESDEDAEEDADEDAEEDDDAEAEFTPKPRPPAKLERLQKILAAAGVASRRSAEGMIEQGRVQVNGKVVTELGTKADAGRDHIRVDGKLLQGPERLRYFILNKPRGFVTTVKDPEGRPTVMQFFDKFKERLYPVGRLDYLSEGLLVVTNDGELANKLTKAASGVEKTYLVKVAGQPTEAELDILRGGVAIERGKPGTSKVRTSPARIRQVRQGDNPWYEVVLIEGRNRELRKMFEEVGHFVEKIRRTGYGPLILDQEPGNLREMEPEEVERLRMASEGKLRTPKSKDLRRRNLMDAGLLPTVLPKPSGRPHQALPDAPASAARPSEFRPKKFGADRPSRLTGSFGRPAFNNAKPFRSDRPGSGDFRPAAGRTSAPNPVRSFSHAEDDRPRSSGPGTPAQFGSARPAGRSFDRPDYRPSARPDSRSTERPAWKKDSRPPARFGAGASKPFQARPAFDRPRPDAPRPSSGSEGSGASRPFAAKPAWKKPERPDFKRSAALPRREAPGRPTPRDFDDDLGPVRPPNLHIEEITGPDRSSSTRPSAPRASYSRPSGGRPSVPRSYSDRPKPSRPSFDRPASSDRPSGDRPRPDRPYSDRPSGDRPNFSRPARSEGGLARPYTTSSGQPRAGGARPSSKPGKFARPGGSKPYGAKSYGAKPGGRSSGGSAPRPFRREEGAGSFVPRSPRPFTPRTEGASDYRPTTAKPFSPSTPRSERKTDTGWRPKTRYGGTGKPAGNVRSKPRPGSSAKPSHRVKPGSKPGGNRRG
jgi:23S rRNA pseudouridine2605 synthase